MDINAQIHRANFAKIAYVELDKCTYGRPRAVMHQYWADAVARGDLMPPADLMDRETVSLKEWLTILDIGIMSWGEDFPAHLMVETSLETMGLGAAYLVVAPDMRSVLTGFSLHYPNIDTNLSIDIEYAKGGLSFSVYYHALSGWAGACFNASAVGLFYKSLASVSGLRTGDGHHVTIHSPRPDSAHLYEDYLNCPVTWDECPDRALGNTWFIPDHVLDRKNPNSHPHHYNLMSGWLWQTTEAAQAQTGDNTSYTSLAGMRLSSAIKIPSQKIMADSLDCSVRTLQQHLKNEGTNWQELVNAEIFNRAKVALSGGASVGAAAEQLGVSIQSIRRLFKRAGTTPKQWVTDNRKIS